MATEGELVAKLVETADALMECTEYAKRLKEALEFYANPDSYFAILVMPDRPAGGFADDFSYADHLAEYGEYNRPMPGKLARETLGIESEEQQHAATEDLDGQGSD